MVKSDMETHAEGQVPGHELTSHFVRSRNVLFVKAALGELFVDYHLHLGDQRIRLDPGHAALFKRALAAFVMHMVARPWNEMVAWTLNFQEPRLNLFLTSDNETGAVTGRVFDENVRDFGTNMFYADVVRARQPRRRSTIEFTGPDPLRAVEAYYRQSEQRILRLFDLGEDAYAFVEEHPDCDRTWIEGLTADAVREIESRETLSVLERRLYRWHCGCDQRRMLEVLLPVMKQDPDGLFGGEESIEIQCPRCSARHRITREAMEAFQQERGGRKE
jgi:molecular chaperone Hsp33